ncbi:GNAT family N-acetyltransferase [Cellulomonas sp. zg-ZUI222]|uniref:GNAT family N-acetyltransferase n=1 Tax=Cellulomonas wangleii TaxID=2816956 RepID=A0ABX8D4X0_9CELL|nr:MULTISPECIES: GNAT family N-acetyltransferase [Cellulomonas]MBO0898459.1 GNAT family N-acetyltransferase [Cellulomonas sp. zg-ZUI22]MBO0919323.1 GNAT family N-acetyltransferase [Cellulomonas wangleii]MBO0924531.1 GNAT family N-acetyltransferase [Cellulomonas wangleii]QVI62518.1 GNAT family N-acetyltransferase [Cellulomonas wangleii]
MTRTDPATTWRVQPAPPLPPSPDDPGAWAYAGMCEIERLDELDTWGWSDLWTPLHVRLPLLRPTPYSRTLVWVAVQGADGDARDVVGYATLSEPLTANEHTAHVAVGVLPEHRGRGIGAALLRAATDQAAVDGRGTLHAYSTHSPEPEPGAGALESPVGSGRVPVEDPGVRFAQAHRFRLEQVERYSVLELGDEHGAGTPELTEHLAAARARAGEEYRTHTWLDEVPDDRLEDVARLYTRMSTDAPMGALDVQENPWDADRVRASLQRAADAGLHQLVTVAEHAPTGRLVAFSVLRVPHPDVPFAFQEDTLVLREHRGRSLGMLVKGVNLERLDAWRPGVRRVHTWNAQENDHMLAINVALGFRQAGVAAAWQRTERGAATPDA